ncbi:hypothetical protein WMW72_21490 [Paenibacillus filicis]|uniref:Uncharacterized protein n=1 Tax=Paenibacillus filicis TaxID=669464 RepID=A0ABU9DQX2_9BACL
MLIEVFISALPPGATTFARGREMPNPKLVRRDELGVLCFAESSCLWSYARALQSLQLIFAGADGVRSRYGQNKILTSPSYKEYVEYKLGSAD